ncbi:AMP-binding enzyme [uncultured archaeon]|nr:AMP-binding enzyme [uncultured archaeon]
MSLDRYPYYLKFIAELRMHQKKKRNELIEIQNKKLKHIINYAYNFVPYYRSLFDNVNLDPYKIKTIEDLQKIPMTTKKDIQANYDKIISANTNIDECKITNTTGSTGIPLRICSDKKSLIYSSALYYFAFFESGLKLMDKSLELTGILEEEKGLLRKCIVSTYDRPEEVIKKVKKYNPDVMYSFPSIFKMMSYYLNSDEVNTRLLFTHGETLTESCRKFIGDTFGAEVFNTYGSTEFNRLAFECSEHSGQHMITDGAIIELVKNGEIVGEGEEGEVVVTGLYNYSMPLIRYKLGDIGILADYECNCGRKWPLIKSIEGRCDDYLTLPSGRILSPRNINVIENIPGILQYRTIQKKKDTFFVQVIPGKDFSIETKKLIEEKIRMGCLGEDIKVEIETVKELSREKTGKLRTIISNINNIK